MEVKEECFNSVPEERRNAVKRIFEVSDKLLEHNGILYLKYTGDPSKIRVFNDFLGKYKVDVNMVVRAMGYQGASYKAAAAKVEWFKTLAKAFEASNIEVNILKCPK